MGSAAIPIALTAASVGTQIYAQRKAAKAQEQYYGLQAETDVEKAQQEYENAKYAIIQAHEVLRKGQAERRQRQIIGQQLLGRQRAEMAAMGIDVGGTTATELRRQSAGVVMEDMLNITHNASLQAWGLEKEAEQHRKQAQMYFQSSGYHKQAIKSTRKGFYLSAFNTLLSGGMQTYNIIKHKHK